LEYIPQIDEVSIEKTSDLEADENGYVPVEIEVVFNPSVSTSALASQIVNTNIKAILSGYEYVTMHIYQPPSEDIIFENGQNNDGRQTVRIMTKAIARHPAQLYESLSSFLLFLLLFYIWYRKKALMPEGLLLGLFLIILFGLRFLYEYVKENQVDFEDSMSLNMGQILSIPLILIGIWLLFNLKKPQAKKSGEE
jgi:phosphatidylglycerol---prolipoprotein diacylglyceryl transferase